MEYIKDMETKKENNFIFENNFLCLITQTVWIRIRSNALNIKNTAGCQSLTAYVSRAIDFFYLYHDEGRAELKGLKISLV